MDRILKLNWPVLMKNAYTKRVKNLFGSAIVAHWPLWEAAGAQAEDISGHACHGAYTGVDLGQLGIGDGKTSPYFDGANDVVNVYSAGLRDAFPYTEGSLLIWWKPAEGAWTDATIRVLCLFRADSVNRFSFEKSSTNGCMVFRLYAGGTALNRTVVSLSFTTFTHIGLTWSAANNRFRAYVGGTQRGADVTDYGTWAGVLASTHAVLGAGSGVLVTPCKGNLAHAILLNREATAAEMLAAARV